MPTPLEEYMQNLISQHKLKESITDADYENDLTQSQAEEAQALYEIDAQPFNLAARSYNMDPEEWVGREVEGRERMKKAVSAGFLNQRAQTVNSKAQGKKQFTQDLLGTLTRLNSVNSQGITSLEQFAPKDAGLRSQLVYDPVSGTVNQVAKNLPDEDAVRNKEIADYLQVPESVVAKQRTQEQQEINDALWKTTRRGIALNKEVRAQDDSARKEEQGKWANVMRKASAANRFSKMPVAAVDQLMQDPDTSPEMKLSAQMGKDIRDITKRVALEKDRSKWMKIADAMARTAIDTDPDRVYQQSIAAGTPLSAIYQQALNGAMEELHARERLGVPTAQTFNIDQNTGDFGFQSDSTLSELEEAAKDREIRRLIGR